MEIIYKNTNELKPYENNPRINDDAVEPVANSIKEFGFKVPIIIDKDNVIIAGHTRLKAAEKLELKKVPCIIADDLSQEQVKAFRLADNKVSEESRWDFEKLDEELENILDIDMSEFCFNDFKLDYDDNVNSNDSEKTIDDKEQFQCTCPKCGFTFIPIKEEINE